MGNTNHDDMGRFAHGPSGSVGAKNATAAQHKTLAPASHAARLSPSATPAQVAEYHATQSATDASLRASARARMDAEMRDFHKRRK